MGGLSTSVIGKVGGPPARSSQLARVAAAASPMQPSVRTTASRQPMGISGGYPKGPGGLHAVEMRLQLEQVQRETREMRAMEQQMHAKMRREEDTQKAVEKTSDRKDLQATRKDADTAMREYILQKKKIQKSVDLTLSREFQETKRDMKQVEHQEVAQAIREDYLDTKEQATHRVQLFKAEVAEQERVPIEDNLDNYRLVAEYRLGEQRREQRDSWEVRQESEQFDLQMKLEQAKRERELAMTSVEFLKGSNNNPVPQNRHLQARPK